MKPTVKLSEVVDYIEMASDGTYTFYNELTGEFYFYSDFGDDDDRDLDEEEGWLRLPNQRDADEYDMMSDFAVSVKNTRIRNQLEIALSGKGAFRRFKDAVIREGVADAWYAFRDRRYMEFARDWCEEEDVPYDADELPDEMTAAEAGDGIRLMDIRDYFELRRLWASVPGIGLNDVDDSLDGIAQYLDRNPDTSFVYEQGGEIFGAILAGHDGRRGFIHRTCVSPNSLEQQVGKQLAEAALNALKSEGISNVALVDFEENDREKGFWERLGFSVRRGLVYRDKSLVKRSATPERIGIIH